MQGTPTPKDRFTALDTLAVVRELRSAPRLRVDKAFDLTDGGWSLALRGTGIGRQELLLVPGRFAAFVPFGSDRSEELSPFAKELRRLLTGAILARVLEPAGERQIEMEFTRGDASGPILLALELFAPGNLLVAVEGRVAAVAAPRRWAHRTVRVGVDFTRAPSRADPFTVSRDEVEGTLSRSRTDLISTLAARLGLGGPLAEELVARLGADPHAPAAAGAPVLATGLHSILAELLSEVGDRPRGFLYTRAGLRLDATPYASRRWAGLTDTVAEERPTFSEAAREYFQTLAPPRVDPSELAAEAARKNLERQADQQRVAIAQLLTEAEDLRAKAERVLLDYARVESAQEAARAQGSREVEVDLDGKPTTLRATGTPRDAAQVLFTESKERMAKLAGARAALIETESRLSTVPPAVPVASRPAPGKAAHKMFWFEKFRWFVSSEGVIVTGGKDASTNDLLVKRHLKDGDRYVHADVHGAASVVVKRPLAGGEIGESTLREAGQWAVSFSKAWRAQHASADAFCVLPEQVSKSPGTGEFVARGSWVIHGTKQFLRDLPLELGLGPVVYEGEERWLAAPPSAVRSRGTLRFLLTPGDERSRAESEVDLARDSGLSRSRLQSLLPAGGLTFRRV